MTENRNCKRQLNISTGVKKSAFLCKNRHNQGFSLVEVLVAMAILAIISLPILTSFANSAKINAKARRVENANTVASDVVEQFKSMSIDELTAKYAGKYHRYESVEAAQAAMSANNAGSPLDETREAQVTDCYVFTVESTGNNGEAFETKVLLDPSAYTNGGIGDANETNNINSYAMPQYSSLSSEQNLIVRDLAFKSDEEALGNLGATASEAGNQVTKRLVLTVSIKKSESGSNKYIQSVDGIMYYNTKSGRTVEKSFNLEELHLTAEQIPNMESKYMLSAAQGVQNVYLFYKPFDVNTTSILTAKDATLGKYYAASDEVEIIYEYPAEEASLMCADLNVYFIQQETKNAKNSSEYVSLLRKNVTISVKGNTSTTKQSVLLSKTNGLGLSTVAGETKGPVNVFSNILKENSDSAGSGISQSIHAVGQGYLYRMTVQVQQGTETLTTVTTTKEN